MERQRHGHFLCGQQGTFFYTFVDDVICGLASCTSNEPRVMRVTSSSCAMLMGHASGPWAAILPIWQQQHIAALGCPLWGPPEYQSGEAVIDGRGRVKAFSDKSARNQMH